MDDNNNFNRRETAADRMRRRNAEIHNQRKKMGRISPFTIIAIGVIIAMFFLARNMGL